MQEEKKTIERRRNILILIAQFCREYGYLQTAEKLQQEGGLAFSKFDVVENIDLMRIVQVNASELSKNGRKFLYIS